MLSGAFTAQAQTTASTDVRQFGVISVEGNNLVVRDQMGTHEYSVPLDFRFTNTRTTTVRPVNLTTIK